MFNADMRERHRYYDLAVSQLREGLQDPSVIARLGDFAMVASNLLADMVPANQKHGVLALPKKFIDINAIPIAIVRPGEEFSLDDTLACNSPVQIGAIREHVRGWGPVQGDATINSLLGSIANNWKLLHGGNRSVKISADNPTGGHTIRESYFIDINRKSFSNLGKSSRRRVIGRPLIALVLDSAGPHPIPSEPLLHETVHVADSESSPIWPAEKDKSTDHRLRRELRGYHYEWFYSLGLYESKKSPFAGTEALLLGPAAAIETLRRREIGNRKDQFEPLGALKAALQKYGLDEIYIS